ncbi:MAG: AarF/UbiB family protein, partial [Bacteroidota bacterium]
KIGGNYVKYYGKKLVNPEISKDELNEDNASDIYDGLKSLRGSALKVAQMLSMEKNLLPRAYVERFSLSQFSVPPLSAPLVRKTFKKYLGQYPEDIFDTFNQDSVNAASIGQVHRASKNEQQLAVKIQYPGVAESIKSDLAIVKPIALKMFNLPSKDSDKYFKEVEHKLTEETDYLLELKQSQEITTACQHIKDMRFPAYYPDQSSERILTMDWKEGKHLGEFVKTPFPQEVGDTLGQALWDFYMYQIHGLRKVHADPHPGNFLINASNQLIAIDFGCIKAIPETFYKPYFELAQSEHLTDSNFFEKKLFELEILTPTDSEDELRFFKKLFQEMLSVFTAPFNHDQFDFGDETFWGKIAALSEQYAKDEQIRKMNANRGSKHFIYMNRTFFGLYNLLYDLKARVNVNSFQKYLN